MIKQIGIKKVLFKDIPVGGDEEFHDGIYINKHGEDQYMVFKKVSKSKAEVAGVVGYPEPNVGGIHHFGPNRMVFVYQFEEV